MEIQQQLSLFLSERLFGNEAIQIFNQDEYQIFVSGKY